MTNFGFIYRSCQRLRSPPTHFQTPPSQILEVSKVSPGSYQALNSCPTLALAAISLTQNNLDPRSLLFSKGNYRYLSNISDLIFFSLKNAGPFITSDKIHTQEQLTVWGEVHVCKRWTFSFLPMRLKLGSRRQGREDDAKLCANRNLASWFLKPIGSIKPRMLPGDGHQVYTLHPILTDP